MNRSQMVGGLFTLSVFGLGVCVGSLAVRPAVSRSEIAQVEILQANADATIAQAGRNCPSFGEFVKGYVDPETGETGEQLLIRSLNGTLSTADLLARYFYGYCLRRGFVE